ncbi:uncharacterized protein LOC129727367 [Wyeomyia smithii]|uniref:uncharacterized protein LOC129727367 n=1 Tax=Wyeomyia smithii TaxID=174621 RepID=UPI002467D09C|nr:uncharacterized protein LOC129727367 [Wyeomyia smithii]XP_055541137.1 uncharacterized protein LOC129727367 [Wyeomyia smithii]
MDSEPKVRRSTRALLVNTDRDDASVDERLVIDVASNLPAPDKTSKQQQMTALTKVITPRKLVPLARKVRRRPKSCSSNSTSDESSREETEGDEDDEPNRLIPKLTRLKAKQLNKKPLPIIPLNAPRPDAEVAALIREELGSDDDDEEYKPTEDEIHSDDDPNTTISDLDSQPRTPATPATPGTTEQDGDNGDACYTKDGLFKIPRPRDDSQCSNLEQEQENIARRTRSKLCLQTTAIETIESTFVPPDITTDMYDFDCEIDHPWKEFLSEFTKPLPNHAEDDDETDPEYVAAGKIPIDCEELREAKVSRKELNELVSELLEYGLNYETFLEDDVSVQSNLIKPDTSTPLEQIQPIIQDKAVIVDEALLQYPASSTTSIQQTNEIITTTALDNNITNMNQQPIHTPVDPVNYSSIIKNTSHTAIDGNVSSKFQTVTNPGLVGTTSFHQNSVNTAILQHSNVDNERFFIQEATLHESSFRPYYSAVPVEYLKSGTLKPVEQRYRYVHTLIPVTVNLNEDPTGFTDFQYQLFQQQLRMHIQLAAQNFLQSYAHPELWSKADQFKNMLLDLQKKFATNLSKPWNLDAAVECCLSWESELQRETEENKELMNFLLAEQEKAKKAKGLPYTSYFPWKMMDKIVDSSVFLYPKLLPYIPFRMHCVKNFLKTIRSEEQLIAVGLETFLPMVEKELSGEKQHFIGKNQALMLACGHISQYFCMPHEPEKIYKCILARRRTAYNKNPIHYYLKHSKAEPFRHVLEKIDFNNVIKPAQYQKNILPHLWDKHIFSNARIKKLYSSSDSSSVASKPKEQTRSIPPHSTTTDSNVNITINVLIDPKDQSAVPVENKTYLNPLPKGTSLEPEERRPKTENTTSESAKQITLASYVSEFEEDSEVAILNNSTPLKNLKSEFDQLPANTKQVLFQEESSVEKNCCKCNCHKKQNEANSKGTPTRAVQKRLTDYFRPLPKKQLAATNRRVNLKEKLWEIFQRYRSPDKIEFEYNGVLLGRVYWHFKLIADYSNFLDDLKTMSSGGNGKKIDSDARVAEHLLPVTNRKVTKVNDVENQDANYAYNFFEKVEETLLGENKHAEYEKFLQILQNFNQKEDRVADLYYRIEKLLSADHPEFVDLFLTFLLPGQAAEVGKFFEHFILTNANDFLAKLNIYFAKQPSQIKKVYSCINELSQEPDVTMEQIKSRILPLLKGNPLLIEWFLQLFPPEKPIESSNLSDYEVISLKKLPSSDCTDAGQIYEDVPFVDVAAETVGESTVCGTKYIQGRILYGTLPARLSFLAHDCIPPPQNESSPIKGCVHNVRNIEKAKGSGVSDSIDDESELPSEAAAKEDPRYKLCDKAAFKAQAIRLNPLVHGGKNANFAEVAHLLTSETDGTIENDAFSEDEKGSSPKKHQASTKLTVTKKRINSPVNRKPTTGKFSPPTSKKLSPILASVPADSKVVSIAKKLKSLADDSVPETGCFETEPVSSTSTVAVKRKPVTSLSPDVLSSAKREKLVKKSPSHDAVDGGETSASEKADSAEESKETGKQLSWAREEDKVILEEIKNGFNTVEELLGRIGVILESRTLSDIRSRYEFLMEVLKKFQKAN